MGRGIGGAGGGRAGCMSLRRLGGVRMACKAGGILCEAIDRILGLWLGFQHDGRKNKNL